MCNKHPQTGWPERLGPFGTKNKLGKHLLSKNSASFPTLLNEEDLNTCRRSRSLLASSLFETRLQGIMVFVLIILLWLMQLLWSPAYPSHGELAGGQRVGGAVRLYQGRGRTLYDAGYIFCVWIIQRKGTSHPVKKSRARENIFWMLHLRSLGK